jgi:hypothetical protein
MNNDNDNIGSKNNISGEKATPITYFIAGFIFISAILFYLGIKLSKDILTTTQYIIFWFIYKIINNFIIEKKI